MNSITIVDKRYISRSYRLIEPLVLLGIPACYLAKTVAYVG